VKKNAVAARKEGLETALEVIKKKGKNNGVPALESRIEELEVLL
jgi:hypothetical protein